VTSYAPRSGHQDGTGDPLPERSEVWVVDDSPAQAEFYARSIAPHHDVKVFHSGAAVIVSFVSRPPPAALIVDWVMPDVPGLEVCQFVRNTLNLNLGELPIIVVTAIAGTGEDVAEALSAGANDFVKKPVSPIELNARLAGLARMAHLHASLRAAEHRLRIEADFRERFMGMLAHDLRQPLQTISMAIELHSSGAAPAQAGAIMGRALRATQRMQRMITELLDFTRNRPESGMPVQKRSTDFEQVAQAILEEMRSAHPNHQFELRTSGACRGHWDPDRLAQVVTNLVSNAVEHGAAGCAVNVSLTGDGEAVELRVSNAGPVMSPEAMATVFDPFRSGRKKEGSVGGVGLGLHIVHQIATAHGGVASVKAENAETQFIVRLPVEAPPVSALKSLPSARSSEA
jgi:signal transduction histidine kinase